MFHLTRGVYAPYNLGSSGRRYDLALASPALQYGLAMRALPLALAPELSWGPCAVVADASSATAGGL